MDLISFSPERCVRALSVNSICDGCASGCPTEAIKIAERLPAINHALCVGCAGCVAVCPTEALVLDNFDSNGFFFQFIGENESIVSCQKNIPCIAALSAEQLISLASLKGDIVCDIGHCEACSIGEEVLKRFDQRIEDVNYLLEATASKGRVLTQKLSLQKEEANDTPERRDFFKTFHLKGLGKIRSDFDKEVQKATDEFIGYTTDSSHTSALRTKKITDRRKLFFTAMKRAPLPDTFHVVDASMISFTSQKLMDENVCTACQMCYRLCPTGALTSDSRNSKIDFDPFLCVKCHLCHDVCEPNAITLSTSYSLKEWYTPTVQNLITYQMRRCNECDTLFSSVAGEKVCRRCQLEEEEAMELWGLSK